MCMEGEPANGVASKGEESGFIAPNALDVDDVELIESRQEIEQFGANKRDYRLNDPNFPASWAHRDQADDPPVPVRENANDSGISGESSRGSHESGESARAWLNSLSNREAFSNLTTREIRNGARNAQKYLEREARHPHLTQHQRDLLQMRLEVYEERRRSNIERQERMKNNADRLKEATAERLKEATALRGVKRAQRARGRAGIQPIPGPIARCPRFQPMPSGRPGAPRSGGRGFDRRGRGRVVVGDARALLHQADMRR
jgi:hypothetical protein